MGKMVSHKAVLAVIIAVLLAASSVGIALAYFSDYEEASGGATLKLGGETEMTEGEDSTDKHIVIENTGDTNMITRVKIFDNEFMTVTLENAADWKESSIEGGKCYCYTKILHPGEKTSAIDAKLKVEWKGEEPDYDFDVTVIHESAQAVYNGKTLATPDGWDDISNVIAVTDEDKEAA